MTMAVLLLIAFYLFLIAEFLLPTGGLMGIAAAAAIISSIVIAFSHSFALGTTLVIVAVFSTPIVIVGLVRIWPHTPIGRRVLNRRPGQVDQAAPPRMTRGGMPMNDLVGMRGIAKTDLLPSGQVIVEDQKVDAVSTGMPIDSGSEIIVTSVQGGRIQVRLVDENDVAVETETVVRSPASLEQSLDDL
jgi:membrane-bound ClpP family serine protease